MKGIIVCKCSTEHVHNFIPEDWEVILPRNLGGYVIFTATRKRDCALCEKPVKIYARFTELEVMNEVMYRKDE